MRINTCPIMEIGLQRITIFEKVLKDILLSAVNITSKLAGAKGDIIHKIKMIVKDLWVATSFSYFLKVSSLTKNRQNRFPYQRVSKNKIVEPRIIPIQLVKMPTTG